MSQDLIIQNGWIAHGKSPDFDAAREEVANFTEEELDTFEAIATGDEATAATRESVTYAINELEDWLSVHEFVVLETPDKAWDCYLAGGSSYGSDPNECFTHFSNLANLPRIWHALGFVWKK